MQKYCFGAMALGDRLFIANTYRGGKAYRASYAASRRHGKKFKITEEDNGLWFECVAVSPPPVMTVDGLVQSLVDWKSGAFVNDLVTATEAVATVAEFDPAITPHKMGRILARMGFSRLRANSTVVWAVRGNYDDLRPCDLWRVYKGDKS